jgi:hypothetical protein
MEKKLDFFDLHDNTDLTEEQIAQIMNDWQKENPTYCKVCHKGGMIQESNTMKCTCGHSYTINN